MIQEDGSYGPIGAVVTNPADDQPVEVQSILDLNDPNTRIYEAHYAMTQDWATTLIDLGYSPDLILSYDRITGDADFTLGNLADQDLGTSHETFHFVLNNYVSKDNRIPPYGFNYDEAKKRNALPVPADQYGDLGSGGTYHYWDEFELNPPTNAVAAEIHLLYQGTSWEYIQFLKLANTGEIGFLTNEGINVMEAWLNTGMANPYIMASAAWQGPSVSTDVATNITANSATLNGSLDHLGEISSASVSFEYGLDNQYGTETSPQLRNGTGPFDATISGLSPGTQYHFRAKAEGDSTTYGVDRVFITADDVPMLAGGKVRQPAFSTESSAINWTVVVGAILCVLVFGLGIQILRKRIGGW